jgi:hypothetical protein
LPPEQKAVGSNPTGRTTSIEDEASRGPARPAQTFNRGDLQAGSLDAAERDGKKDPSGSGRDPRHRGTHRSWSDECARHPSTIRACGEIRSCVHQTVPRRRSARQKRERRQLLPRNLEDQLPDRGAAYRGSVRFSCDREAAVPGKPCTHGRSPGLDQYRTLHDGCEIGEPARPRCTGS